MQPSMTTQQSESVAHDTAPRAYARPSSREAPLGDDDDDVLHATSASPTTTSTEERTTLGRR